MCDLLWETLRGFDSSGTTEGSSDDQFLLHFGHLPVQ